MIDFMILNILQKEGLAKYIKQNGLMDIYENGTIQIKIGGGRVDPNMFVALKSLNNSKNVTLEFINEV